MRSMTRADSVMIFLTRKENYDALVHMSICDHDWMTHADYWTLRERVGAVCPSNKEVAKRNEMDDEDAILALRSLWHPVIENLSRGHRLFQFIYDSNVQIVGSQKPTVPPGHSFMTAEDIGVDMTLPGDPNMLRNLGIEKDPDFDGDDDDESDG